MSGQVCRAMLGLMFLITMAAACGPIPTPSVVKEAVEATRIVELVTVVVVTATPLPTKTALERAEALHRIRTQYAIRDMEQTATVVSCQQRRQALDDEAKRISYGSLARNTEQYVEQLLYHRGKVVQVMEIEGFIVALRVNVTQDKYGFWKDTVWVNYEGPRVLEDDIVGIWARVEGRRAYTSVLGQQIVIPELTAVLLEIRGRE